LKIGHDQARQERLDRRAEHGRVLDGAGKPILGLYASGSDMHAVFGGFYPGGGGAIGPAMTFGHLAAKDMIDEQGTDGA